MKKVLSFIILLFVLIFSFTSCDIDTSSDESDSPTDYSIDYSDAASFENALNDGTKAKGKVVQFYVNDYVPDSILGFNCHAGEHLNFIFEDDLDVEKGDTIIVRVTEEPSKIFLFGSWKVPCEFLELVAKKQDTDTGKKPSTESQDMAKIPDTWLNLLEKHYEDVKKQFEDAGFTNIICVPHEIDYNENNVFEGSVVNIAIGNNGEKCIFEKDEEWPKDTKIRIDYRVKPTQPAKPDTTKIVLPKTGSKLAKDFDTEGQNTIYYINVDGRYNTPSIKTWKFATVTDGVAEYLDYLEELGFTVKITDTSYREPHSGFYLYETDFEISNSSVSWTMYLCIQKEDYIEYELDIHKN